MEIERKEAQAELDKQIKIIMEKYRMTNEQVEHYGEALGEVVDKMDKLHTVPTSMT